MGIGDWLRKVESLARKHSKHADQALDKAEQIAKERTGHKYDEHISKGADAVQRRYGGGQSQPPAQGQPPTQGQQPPLSGQPPAQGQQPPTQRESHGQRPDPRNQP